MEIHLPTGDARMMIVSVVEQGLPIMSAPLVACLTLLAALLTAHSRAGLTSTLCGIIFLFGLLSCRKKMRQLLLPLLVIALVCGSFVIGLSGDTVERFGLLSYSGERGRLDVYAIMLEAIRTRPWAGFGYGNFEQAYGLFSNEKVATYYDRGHNDYLELTLGVGLPAAVLLIFAILWLAGRSIFGACLSG